MCFIYSYSNRIHKDIKKSCTLAKSNDKFIQIKSQYVTIH